MSQMKTTKIVYWQDEEMWSGYLEEYPDNMTQGESLDELQNNLREVYHDLASGVIPSVRKTAELDVA